MKWQKEIKMWMKRSDIESAPSGWKEMMPIARRQTLSRTHPAQRRPGLNTQRHPPCPSKLPLINLVRTKEFIASIKTLPATNPTFYWPYEASFCTALPSSLKNYRNLQTYWSNNLLFRTLMRCRQGGFWYNSLLGLSTEEPLFIPSTHFCGLGSTVRLN